MRMTKADVQVLERMAPQWRLHPNLRALWLFCKRKPLGAVGAVLLFAFVGVAILAPALATHDPDLNNYRARVKPPSAEHWFGTDGFGRDIYSRVVYGARLSMYVGVLATLLGTTLGALAGLLSGFLGGRIDQLIQRCADVLFTLPGLILAMAIVTMLGPSMLNVVIAIAIPRLPSTNRVIRSAVLSAKESLYVEASRAIGCQLLAHHAAAPPPQCDRPVYCHCHGRSERGHPGRSLPEFFGPGSATASAVVGPYAVGGRHALFRDGAVDGDLPRSVYQRCGLWRQLVWRRAARCARPQITWPVRGEEAGKSA